MTQWNYSKLCVKKAFGLSHIQSFSKASREGIPSKKEVNQGEKNKEHRKQAIQQKKRGKGNTKDHGQGNPRTDVQGVPQGSQ